MLTALTLAFTGAPALSKSQESAVEMLLGLKKVYFNAKREEEWECLTVYLQTVISWTKVVRKFTAWPDMMTRLLKGWNPYKERVIAQNLTATKMDGQPIYRPDRTMQAALAQYKIPKGAKGTAKNPPPLAKKLPAKENQAGPSSLSKKKAKSWKNTDKNQWKSVIKMAKTLVEVKEALKEA